MEIRREDDKKREKKQQQTKEKDKKKKQTKTNKQIMMSRNSEKLCSNKINVVQSGSSNGNGAPTFALNKKKKKRKKRTAPLKYGKQTDKSTSYGIIQNTFINSSNLSLAQSASSFYDIDELLDDIEIVPSETTNGRSRFYCYPCELCKSIECQCDDEKKSESVNSSLIDLPNGDRDIGANGISISDSVSNYNDQLNLIDNNNTDSLAELIDVCELRKNKQQSNNNNNRACSKGEQLHRFAIYENLCKHCGFAIGNADDHLHCIEDTTQGSELQRNFNSVDRENSCSTCHSIYSGENMRLFVRSKK